MPDEDDERIEEFKRAFRKKSPTVVASELSGLEEKVLRELKSLHEQRVAASNSTDLLMKPFLLKALDERIERVERRRRELEVQREEVERWVAPPEEPEELPSSVPPPPPEGSPPPPPPGGLVPPPPLGGLAPPPSSGGEDPPEVEEGEVFEGEPVGEFTTVARFGKGIWASEKVSVYRASKAVTVPQSGFKAVLPGQPHVNLRVVEAKLEKGLPDTPLVPVLQLDDGKIVLRDKHHTFVAALAIGRSVKLAMSVRTIPPGMGKVPTSWRGCSWKGFEPPAKADSGYRVTPEEQSTHEGEIRSSGDWRSIVSWRANTPGDTPGKTEAMKRRVPGIDFGSSLLDGCTSQPGLDVRLYEMMTIDDVKVKVRKPPEHSTGGDWDPGSNTIWLDDTLDPLAATDMLVFESLNAEHQKDYQTLQHRAHEERMGIDEFGPAKASIEATVTLEYVEFLLACQAAGKPVAESGRKALAAMELRRPGYARLSPEDRKKEWPALTQMIIDTPHGGPTKRLPDRMALSTKDLYGYEQLAVKQGMKGVRGYFRDKAPRTSPHVVAFRLALDAAPDSSDTRCAPLFYAVVRPHANRLFGAGVPALTAPQLEVAEHEYTEGGGTWRAELERQLSLVV